MKKNFIIILCVIFLIGNFSVFGFAEYSDVNADLPQFGAKLNPLLPDGYDLCEYLINRADVNEDGKITPSDARLALRAVTNLELLSDNQKIMADIDIDGEITTNDARGILRLAASLESGLCTVRVVVSAGEYVTLGPLKGNSDYCWYIKTNLSLYPPVIKESRIPLSDNEFEQQFDILATGLFYGSLVYGSVDGETVIKEYDFEIDGIKKWNDGIEKEG